MTLKTACSIGAACGIKTTGDAVSLVSGRATSVFEYSKIGEELRELREELKEIGDHRIEEVFPELRNAHLDAEFYAAEGGKERCGLCDELTEGRNTCVSCGASRIDESEDDEEF